MSLTWRSAHPISPKTTGLPRRACQHHVHRFLHVGRVGLGAFRCVVVGCGVLGEGCELLPRLGLQLANLLAGQQRFVRLRVVHPHHRALRQLGHVVQLGSERHELDQIARQPIAELGAGVTQLQVRDERADERVVGIGRTHVHALLELGVVAEELRPSQVDDGGVCHPGQAREHVGAQLIVEHVLVEEVAQVEVRMARVGDASVVEGAGQGGLCVGHDRISLDVHVVLVNEVFFHLLQDKSRISFFIRHVVGRCLLPVTVLVVRHDVYVEQEWCGLKVMW